MKDFLITHLRVPTERIRVLVDHKASRQGLLDALFHLSEEGIIAIGDPILIYFAGHGTQVDPPPFWDAGGAGRKIQAICPCDYQREGTHVIPDRTLGAYIAFISEKKGNNITVIFDCCHSSSGTRLGVPTTGIRGVVLDNYELPPTVDWSDLRVSSHFNSRNAFGVPGLGTHVLISSCGERETAKENDGRGRFTLSLLELFSQDNTLETLTYTDILKRIRHIPDQNPQVEGIHRDRFIFCSTDNARQTIFYTISSPQGDQFDLDIGSIHGITVGSQFSIYQNHESFLACSPLGALSVSKVTAFKSFLRAIGDPRSLNLRTNGIAVLLPGGESRALHVTVPQGTHLPNTYQRALEALESKQIVSTKASEGDTIKPKISLQIEAGSIVLKILDPSITACGHYRLYESIKLTTSEERFTNILSSGSNFFWHFERNCYHHILEFIKIEFFELATSETLDDIGHRFLGPTSESLLRDGSIDIFVGPSPKAYGIKISNDSHWDLFPAAFYFDHSDWSIVTYYHPGTAGQYKLDPPLLKNGGTLTIGYGTNGSEPISFRFNHSDQDLDVGHLKIFFSTKAMDIRHISQDSPFTGASFRADMEAQALHDGWTALQYPIIQRRCST